MTIDKRIRHADLPSKKTGEATLIVKGKKNKMKKETLTNHGNQGDKSLCENLKVLL